MQNAQIAKAEKYLNSLVRCENEITTVKAWLNNLKEKGFLPVVESIRDTNKEEKEKERLRRTINSWGFPIGNPNHPECKQYYADKAELEKGFYKTVYLMRSEKSSYVITKTAYDYLTV